uniref:Uncharacterized protein n=1 Tax=Timema tahoe TaxID=61484 RepID=A0A7R9P1E9_9NEOP|nr:unnamed protein product [Timema tahoe]
MIKEEINNNIMKSALRYLNHNEGRVLDYLRSIKPLFPRFLSEYLSGTYLGIVQDLVGLFQNSKTIRTIFSKNIDKRIKRIIVQSELQTIEGLCKVSDRYVGSQIWRCSSSKADKLRWESWGDPVHGAIVPHPIELISRPIRQGPMCPPCQNTPPLSYYVSILVPHGLTDYKKTRGPYKAYLGSKTSETTSVLRPWEREAKVPLIKRAAKLRSAIGWFVESDSKLGKGIIQNLESLTGECWKNKIEGSKRTGSALHRFSCSRQSSAGYAAQSPSKLTWMCMTTDTLSILNSVNHDFMHQSLLIYAQATVAELMDGRPEQGYFHSHISCTSCLREIQEIRLYTVRDFVHEDVSDIISKWKPEDVSWSKEYPLQEIKHGNWYKVHPCEQSFHIGRACGFLYGELKMSNDTRCEDSSIFPLSLQNKVFPRQFLDGVLDGLIRASSIHCVSRRSISELKRPREALLGIGLHLINEISNHQGLVTMWRSESFETAFMDIPYKVPPSYPLSNRDLGSLGRAYLRYHYLKRYVENTSGIKEYRNIWIW